MKELPFFLEPGATEVSLAVTLNGHQFLGTLPVEFLQHVTWTGERRPFGKRRIRVAGIDPMLHYRYLRQRRLRKVPVAVGQVFDSVSEAARLLGVPGTNFSSAIRHNKPVAGFFFKDAEA